MSPTIFRGAGFRFFFFSREEARLHVHVHCADGEAKFWLEPEIELAQNLGAERPANPIGGRMFKDAPVAKFMNA